MTRLLTPLFFWGLFVTLAGAQEAPGESELDSPAKLKQVAPAPAPELPGDSLPLIPDAFAPAKKPKSAPQKKSSTEQASDDLRTRIRYRAARTKAMQEPKLRVEWERAQAAKTEPEKRAAMKSYYQLFCDRVVKIDPGSKPRIDLLRQTLAWRFDPGPGHRRQLEKLAKPLDEEFAETARFNGLAR